MPVLEFSNLSDFSYTGRFLSEDPIQDGANWYRYAGNDPINFRDPTGLSQAGNPLNALAGGFGGNVVRQENTALRNLNTSFLASPTVNYNSLNSPYASGPVKTNTPSRINSGITTVPVYSPSRSVSKVSQREHQAALADAALLGLHGPTSQRAADRAFDRQVRESSFIISPELIGATQSRLSNDVLRSATGLTSREAALGVTKTIIGATGQTVRRSDEWFVQQPGFSIVRGAVETAANPFTYTPVLVGASQAVRILDNLPSGNHSSLGYGRRIAMQTDVEFQPYSNRGAFMIPGQAHHLNQSEILGGVVPYQSGVTTPLVGRAFLDVDTPHFTVHRGTEAFYVQYRRGTTPGAKYQIPTGPLYPSTPTFSQYNRALYNSLQEAGIPSNRALRMVIEAKREQLSTSFRGTTPLLDFPSRLGQAGGP